MASLRTSVHIFARAANSLPPVLTSLPKLSPVLQGHHRFRYELHGRLRSAGFSLSGSRRLRGWVVFSVSFCITVNRLMGQQKKKTKQNPNASVYRGAVHRRRGVYHDVLPQQLPSQQHQVQSGAAVGDRVSKNCPGIPEKLHHV